MTGATRPDIPAAKVCEHFYASHCYRGMSVRLCMLCHEPDWDDLAGQLDAAHGSEVASAVPVPGDTGRDEPTAPERSRERAGAVSPDDREPYGRIAWEAETAWALEQPHPWPVTRQDSWEEIHPAQRELFMRIGSAVAARAVADAGGEDASARTDRDRMRMERGALQSYLPAALEALSAAIADSEYEHQKRRFKAARVAFEALEAGAGQEPLSATCTGPDCGEQFADSETGEYLFASRERMERLLHADGWASDPVLRPACQQEAGHDPLA